MRLLFTLICSILTAGCFAQDAATTSTSALELTTTAVASADALTTIPAADRISENVTTSSWEPTTGAPIDPVPPAELETGGRKTRVTTGVLTVDVAETTNPWTHLNFLNNPEQFQFAIVTDRTGGHRPGIFETAITKLNLLRPEFVISVGDLIEGYTDDLHEINRQWNEFMGFTAQLTMPFFYVPGNHDLSNKVMHEQWRLRFGREYYHFVYRDVLFLCVNSEDPVTSISAEQVEYFRKALDENQDVRWTLLFLHKPLWVHSPVNLNGNEAENYTGAGWLGLEQLLHGRDYTVFAGHVHHYTKAERLGKKYITLGTTGGGSAMRGAFNYGEFDHVVWVTMTELGPLVANLELSGIYDENVRTEDVALLANKALREAVQTQTIVTDSLPFKEIKTQLRLVNTADIPLRLQLQFEPHRYARFQPDRFNVTVNPNSVHFAELKLDGTTARRDDDLSVPLKFGWKATYPREGKDPVEVSGQRQIEFDPKHTVPRLSKVKIDGRLGEWATLPVAMNQPWQITGQAPLYKGTRDSDVRFAVAHDDEYLYLAARVTDDRVVTGSKAKYDRDSFAIHLMPQAPGTTASANWQAENRRIVEKKKKRRRLRDLLQPATTETLIYGFATWPGEKSSTHPLKGMRMPEDVRVESQATSQSYTIEAAIPIDHLSPYEEDWASFRLNLVLRDVDEVNSSRFTDLWWRPFWNSAYNYPESGTFLRSSGKNATEKKKSSRGGTRRRR